MPLKQPHFSLASLVIALCVACLHFRAATAANLHPDSDKASWETKFAYLLGPDGENKGTQDYQKQPAYKPGPEYREEQEPEYQPEPKEQYKQTHYKPEYKEYREQYKPEYKEQYKPEYKEQYKPEYNDQYKPEYQEQYKPDYNPEYKEQYKPSYEPDYKPYNPPEQYKPEYQPHEQYKPDYKPSEQYKPEYKLSEQYAPHYQEPQYSQDKDSHYTAEEEAPYYGQNPGYKGYDSYKGDDSYKPEYKEQYKPEYKEQYKPEYSYAGEDSYKDQEGGHEKEYESKSDYGYEKHDAPIKHQICLQEDTRMVKEVTTPSLTRQFESTFRCCKHIDRPDTCLEKEEPYHSDPEGPYEGSGSGPYSDSLLDTYIARETAAACSWSYVSDFCPPHLLHTCLGSGTISCTLTTAACDCGSPDKKLQFTAEGHFIGLESLSCDEWYGQVGAPGVVTSMTGGTNSSSTPDTMDGLFAGMAWLFRGDIHVFSNTDGIQEGKGAVEFIPAVGDVPEAHAIRQGRHLLADAPTNAALAGAVKDAAVTAPIKEAPKPAEQPKAAPVKPPAKETHKAAEQTKAAPAQPTPVKETPKPAPVPAKDAPKPAEQPKAAPVNPIPVTDAPKAAARVQPTPVQETPKPAPVNPAPAKEAPKPAEQPKAAPTNPAPTKDAPKPAEQPKSAPAQPTPIDKAPQATPVHPAPTKPQQPSQRAPATQQPQQKQASSALPRLGGVAKRQVRSGGSHKHRFGKLDYSAYEGGLTLPLVKGGSLKVVLFEKENKEY